MLFKYSKELHQRDVSFKTHVYKLMDKNYSQFYTTVKPL